MQTENLVKLDEFCTNHKIKASFIDALSRNGMIEVTTVNEAGFIDSGQLLQLEKIVHLYFELDINLEGIETINYLLMRINSMHDEMITLRNRLRLNEMDI